MKIRSDYVTNSSSSSFTIMIQIIDKKGKKYRFFDDPYRGNPDCGGEITFTANMESLLNKQQFSSVHELMNYLTDSMESDASYIFSARKARFAKSVERNIPSVNDISSVMVDRFLLEFGEGYDGYNFGEKIVKKGDKDTRNEIFDYAREQIGVNWYLLTLRDHSQVDFEKNQFESYCEIFDMDSYGDYLNEPEYLEEKAKQAHLNYIREQERIERSRNSITAISGGMELLDDETLAILKDKGKLNSLQEKGGVLDKNGFGIYNGKLLVYKGAGGNLILPDGITELIPEVFAGRRDIRSVVVPEGVKRIGENAFENCSGLETITLPDSVNDIASRAFRGCRRLQGIALPHGLTRIAPFTFENCDKLTHVDLPDSILSIGEKAFKECKNLLSAHIPDHLKVIGTNAFENCKSLILDDNDLLKRSESNPDHEILIGANAFRGCKKMSDEDGFVIISGILFQYYGTESHVTVPEGISRIDDMAFYNCLNLEEIVLDHGIRSIGKSVFQGCGALKCISLPEGLEEIENAVFYHCKELQNVTLPGSLKRIGDLAFSDCPLVAFCVMPNSYAERYAVNNGIPFIHSPKNKMILH